MISKAFSKYIVHEAVSLFFLCSYNFLKGENLFLFLQPWNLGWSFVPQLLPQFHWHFVLLCCFQDGFYLVYFFLGLFEVVGVIFKSFSSLFGFCFGVLGFLFLLSFVWFCLFWWFWFTFLSLRRLSTLGLGGRLDYGPLSVQSHRALGNIGEAAGRLPGDWCWFQICEFGRLLSWLYRRLSVHFRGELLEHLLSELWVERISVEQIGNNAFVGLKFLLKSRWAPVDWNHCFAEAHFLGHFGRNCDLRIRWPIQRQNIALILGELRCHAKVLRPSGQGFELQEIHVIIGSQTWLIQKCWRLQHIAETDIFAPAHAFLWNITEQDGGNAGHEAKVVNGVVELVLAEDIWRLLVIKIEMLKPILRIITLLNFWPDYSSPGWLARRNISTAAVALAIWFLQLFWSARVLGIWFFTMSFDEHLNYSLWFFNIFNFQLLNLRPFLNNLRKCYTRRK